MAQLNFVIPDDLLARIDAAKPEYLDRKGFLCLLLDRSLDTSGTLGLAEETKASPSTLITSKKTYKDKSIYPNLEKHTELIQGFWRVKKGSKSDQGWKLLMTELTKLQKTYGDTVVEEQLQLAINGLWKGVSLRLYEQFKAPKGGAPVQPEMKHPAAREFRNGRFLDEDGPATNPAMEGLF